MSDSQRKLEGLYPFLHGKVKEPMAENTALLESVRQKVGQCLSVQERFFAENAQKLIDISHAIADVYRSKRRMFSMGNGGSSCDAAHFAVEFQHPVTAGRPSLPAVNLSMDAAMLTAVANDVGVEYMFSRQVEALGEQGDGLIGFSTSGNSRNLIEAYRVARNKGMLTFGMSGGDGGLMLSSGLVEHCLVVPTDSIHRVQEVHVATYHMLWDLIHTLLADSRGLIA